MRVATIVGTRPEVIRLSRVVAAFDHYFQHCLIHTGQNFDYELNEVFFDDLEIRPPDRYLCAAGGTAAETIGRVVATSDAVLRELRPEAVLVLGDTNSCLAAIAAKRLRIPVFHMEAGNRCFDERVPEEINRRMVDHIADINLPYSSLSREYLLREGLPPDRIIKTGSPMYEVLNHYGTKSQASPILRKLELVAGSYFLVSAHREENVDDEDQFELFIELLHGLADRFGMPIVVSAHPRTRKRLEETGAALPDEAMVLKPFSFSDYVKLQTCAKAVLSDSGTISEEASILNLPALNLRQAHERPEAMEEGAAILTGLSWPRVAEALQVLEEQPTGDERLLCLVKDYEAPHVSEKVVRIVLSYTDYVNRVVWRAGPTRR